LIASVSLWGSTSRTGARERHHGAVDELVEPVAPGAH
jgi:hypothetical protein